MGVFDNFIKFFKGSRRDSTLVAAVVNDPDTAPPEPGASTVLRVDPTTGALLVSGAGGGGGPSSLVDQGGAASAAGAWPVKVTDGTSVLGTETHPFRTDPTGDTTQPVEVVNQPQTIAPEPTIAAMPGEVPVGATVLYVLDQSDGSFKAVGWSDCEGVACVNVAAHTVEGEVLSTVASQGQGVVARPWYIQGSNGVDMSYELAKESSAGSAAASLESLDAKLPDQGPALMTAALPVTIATNQTAFPVNVSGTVTASQGTAATLSGGWPVKLTDGSALLGTQPAPVRIDPVGTTAQPVGDGGGSLTVDSAQLPASLGAGGGLKVDGSGTALPVSDGGGSLTVDGSVSISGTPTVDVSNFPSSQNVVVTSSALPAGAATEGTLSTLNTKIPASPAQDRTTAAAPAAARLSDGSGFYKAAIAGDNMGADLRVSSAAVSAGNPVPVSDAGGSLTVDSAQLPAALGAGGGLKIDGSGAALPVSAASLPLPSGAAQEHATAGSPHAARLSDGSSFYKGAVAGDNMGANLRVSSADVSSTNPVPTRSEATELAPSWIRTTEDGFGRTVTVEPSSVIQETFTYGCPPTVWNTYATGTGTATSTADGTSLGTVSVGATGSSIAELRSRARWTYRAGQSIRLMFTAVFSAPASGGTQMIGMGPFDGYGVGYNGTAFGFWRRSGGVCETRTFTVTTASTTTQSITVTLDGVGTTVAVTNSGNTVTTAREIAAGDYSAAGPGWNAYQFGSTVIFVARRTGSRAGTYSITATTAVVSVARTLAGVDPTDTWYAKTAWNGDRLDGSAGANNASGATLDPTKLSVWQIVAPYLGAGNVVLQWLDPTTGRWTTCHTIAGPNSSASVQVLNPSFNLFMYATGAANLTVASASMAMFCDGKARRLSNLVSVGPVFKTTVGNASELVLLTLRVEPTYFGAQNRGGFIPLEVAASAGATGQVMIRAYLNGTLSGPSNFQAANPYSSISYDTGATSVANGIQVGNIITAPSGGSTSFDVSEYGYRLEAGDTVTFTAQQTSGTNGTVAIAVLGTEENGME